MSKINRTIAEIIDKGNLKEYSSEVSDIVKAVDAEGCGISCHYIPMEPSSHSFGPSSRYIRIAMYDRTKPLEIIWDILHELGHCLSGKRNPEDTDMQREILAWDKAFEKLNHYEKLMAFESDFISYRKYCLSTYEKAEKFT